MKIIIEHDDFREVFTPETFGGINPHISFRLIEDEWTTDTDGKPLRIVKKAELLECSLIPPLYPKTDADETR